MGICIMYKCGMPTDGNRLLCASHTIKAKMENPELCQACKRNMAQTPGVLCKDCEERRK